MPTEAHSWKEAPVKNPVSFNCSLSKIPSSALRQSRLAQLVKHVTLLNNAMRCFSRLCAMCECECECDATWEDLIYSLEG